MSGKDYYIASCLGVLRHKQRYFSYICDGTDVQANGRRSLIIVWGKTTTLPVVRGKDNYTNSYQLKYYHIITNCLGEKLLYSQLIGDNTTI